jgi:hypothetical protein
MTWIEPLNLQVWIMSVFAGSPDIFLAVALLVISGMAGFFRMKVVTLFFMIGIFLLMFSGFVSSPLIIFIAVIAGLLIGFVISTTFNK